MVTYWRQSYLPNWTKSLSKISVSNQACPERKAISQTQPLGAKGQHISVNKGFSTDKWDVFQIPLLLLKLASRLRCNRLCHLIQLVHTPLNKDFFNSWHSLSRCGLWSSCIFCSSSPSWSTSLLFPRRGKQLKVLWMYFCLLSSPTDGYITLFNFAMHWHPCQVYPDVHPIPMGMVRSYRPIWVNLVFFKLFNRSLAMW